MADAKSKLEAVEQLLAKSSIRIHLDSRRPGVDVPKQHRKNPHLILDIGYSMPVPIPDLVLSERGIDATLSFKRKPYRCHIPWASVFAVMSSAEDRGTIWSEDAPPEVASHKGTRTPLVLN